MPVVKGKTGAKSKKKKKKVGAVTSTFTFTALETDPSWFDGARYIHLHCTMLGMEALVVDLGVVCATSVTVGELKLILRDKFESLLGEFVIYSPNPPVLQPNNNSFTFGDGNTAAGLSRNASSRFSAFSPDTLSPNLSAASSSGSFAADIGGAVTTRMRSTTLPTRPGLMPKVNQKSKATVATRKLSSMVTDDSMKLDHIDNVQSSDTRESAPKVYFLFTCTPPEVDCPLIKQPVLRSSASDRSRKIAV